MRISRQRLIEIVKEELIDPSIKIPVPAASRPSISMSDAEVEESALDVLDVVAHMEPDLKRLVLNKAIHMANTMGTSGSPSILRVVTEKEKYNE